MSYSFTAWGHPNITSKHKATLEFTKDAEVTPTGDCIVGCKADFELKKLKEFIAAKQSQEDLSATLTIQVGKLKESIRGTLNTDFKDEHELVLRRSDFLSERTLMIRCNKTSKELPNPLRILLKNPKTEIVSTLE